MIRDEYQNSQKERKKSVKEIEGIKRMGERSYYTMQAKKLLGNIKTLKLNTMFLLGFGLTLLVSIIVGLVLVPSSIKDAYMIIAIIADFIMLGWVMCWFLFVKRMLNNKIETYKEIAERHRLKEMERQKNAYKIYLKKEN